MMMIMHLTTRKTANAYFISQFLGGFFFYAAEKTKTKTKEETLGSLEDSTQ